MITLREDDLTKRAGEFVIIPRGVEHLPVAEEEARILLLEPKTTLNAGDVQNERTVKPDWIYAAKSTPTEIKRILTAQLKGWFEGRYVEGGAIAPDMNT